MNWLKLIIGLFSALATWANNKRIADGAKAEAELEGRKEIDKISDDIAIAKSDDELRKSVRKKYTRKPSDTV